MSEAGALAEEQVLRFLLEQGLTLKERNYHCRFGEIDLILMQAKTVVFVEVRMRRNQASLDLAKANKVAADDQGLERFLTTTRRQNFLVPPRRYRSFPLVEKLP